MPDRITRIVDVTGSYPGANVRGAFVLVDSKLSRDVPREDFRRRPVLVVYETKRAAAHAARASSPSRRVAEHVLFVPATYPQRVKQEYLQVATVGAG